MASASRPKVIAVVGPTATGKTRLGVELAKALDGEVISADSQVVYRHLDIGTAKPTTDEMQGIPHHMLDVALPNEQYSVARYKAEAIAVLNDIIARGKTPVVVGGTGFYLQALLQVQSIPEVPPDEAFRAEMEAVVAEHGAEALYQQLQLKDPERAAMLHPNDTFRVIRALEIIYHTGQNVPEAPVSDHPELDVCWVGLTYASRDTHRAVIDRRIDEMMDQGWLAEVQSLIERFAPTTEALQVAHGYPELVKLCQGEMTREEALAQTRLNIHQYSRRQGTWFRKNKAISWFHVDEIPLDTILNDVLSQLC